MKNKQDDPIQLPELLDQQKKRISHIVNEKNEVIKHFQNDLQRLNDDYNNYQVKYVIDGQI